MSDAIGYNAEVAHLAKTLTLPASTARALEERRASDALVDALRGLAERRPLPPDAVELLRECGLHNVLARGYELAFDATQSPSKAWGAARAWRAARHPRRALLTVANALPYADEQDRREAWVIAAAALADLMELDAASVLAERAILGRDHQSMYAHRVVSRIARLQGFSRKSAVHRLQAEHIADYYKALQSLPLTEAARAIARGAAPNEDAAGFAEYSREVRAKRQRGKRWYQEYLGSTEWKARRRTALEAAHYVCERCSVGGLLHVHHVTYARVGDEAADDLEVLCPECHSAEHDEERRAVERMQDFVGQLTLVGSVRCQPPPFDQPGIVTTPPS